MREEKLMEAIGGLDDRYILEFAQPEAAKPSAHWLLPVAASLCLLAGAVSLYVMDGGEPPVSMEQPSANTTISTTVPTASREPSLPQATMPEAPEILVWLADNHHFHESGTGFGSMAETDYPFDEVTILPMLQGAMEQYPDPNVRFAVVLGGVTVGFPSEVYETVAEDLGVDWDEEQGIFFLTEEQIRSIQCPEDTALCLGLARKQIDQDITLDLLETMEQETIRAEVIFYFPDIYDAYRQEYTSGGYRDYDQWEDALNQAMIARLKTYAEALGLPVEAMEDTMSSRGYAFFTAEFSKEQLYRLLTEDTFDALYEISPLHPGAYYEELYEEADIG